MKKFIILLFALLFVGFANAQFQLGVPAGITADESGQAVVVKTTPVVGTVHVSTPVPLNRATIFSEGFETAPVVEPFGLPTGWTSISTSGCTENEPDAPFGTCAWSTAPWEGFDAHSGSRYASILYTEAGLPTHNAWAISPEFTLTSGTTYVISFWVQTSAFYDDYLEVKIGNSPTPASLTTSIYNSQTTPPTSNNWIQISYSFTPTTTGGYYLGFHDFSPTDQWYILVDDILVSTPDLDASIKANIIANTPVNHANVGVPVAWGIVNSGTLPFATATVSSTVTPGTFSVYSTAIQGPAVGATANYSWNDLAPVPSTVGTIATATHTVTLEGDSNPSNNTASNTFEVTQDIFSKDNGVANGGLGSSSGAILMGSVYTFAVSDYVREIQVYFSNTSATNIEFRIYSVPSNGTGCVQVYNSGTIAKPTTTGWYTHTLPYLELPAGRYFFGIQQLATPNMGFGYSAGTEYLLYTISTAGVLQYYTTLGTPMLRVKVANPPATPAAPTAFTATPDAGGALNCTLTWTNPTLGIDGSTLSALTGVTIKRDGVEIATYATNLTPGAIGCTYIDNGVPAAGNYTYTIYATNTAGDGIEASQTVYVGGDPCTITSFPWTESFDAAGTVFPGTSFYIPDACWASYSSGASYAWKRVTI
ncbi:MAG: choice-of-anchor J domain-containing protein, partial [Bacteroidales bacterium]|nr:choice-of-anchor J domain-containing protein [Bacteroidales bacterium]